MNNKYKYILIDHFAGSEGIVDGTFRTRKAARKARNTYTKRAGSLRGEVKIYKLTEVR